MNFRVPTNHRNPPDNATVFEEYFGVKFLQDRPSVKRRYLDVFWTNYYVSKNYCNDDMSDLQQYLDKLDRNTKYFTVCQWDDGIRNNVDGLDLITYGSGGYGDYAYPLNCMPHNRPPSKHREIMASFIGSLFGRHPVREKMYQALHGKNGVLIHESLGRTAFLDVLNASVFALCPRGYGKTSFRICEALESRVIPVYIYDEPWIPFGHKLDFESYGVLCHVDELDTLYDRLTSFKPEEIQALIDRGGSVYKDYYSYDGCYNQIIEDLI